MATYNGARYLREQLDSIAGQTLLPLELVVGDDGSTDATLAVLHAFAETAPFPVSIHRNPANLGFADNFLSTAARCAGDWIAFCDQDDRWYPDKLASVAEAAAKSPTSHLVVHLLDRASDDGSVTGDRLPKALPKGSDGPMRQKFDWAHGGCAMAFDARLVRDIDWTRRPLDRFDWSSVSRPTQRQWPHDRWISLLGNLVGPIALIDRPLGIFRRHEGTVSGSHLVPLSQRLALMAGAPHYARAAIAAEEGANVLEHLANGVFAANLRAGGIAFRDVAAIQRGRQALYEAGARWRRLALWRRLLVSGAYTGERFRRAGLQAGAKDFLIALVGDRIGDRGDA